VDTVRGWLRRAAGRAGQVREVFTRVAAAVSADPVPLEPAGSPLADALVAVAAAAAAAGRWPRLLAVSPWEIAAAVTNATLLAPVMAARMFNASSLWSGGAGGCHPRSARVRGYRRGEQAPSTRPVLVPVR
jgi:hypothetical protein